MNELKKEFGDYLYDEYVSWLSKQPDRPSRNFQGFSKFLGVSKSMCYLYLKKQRKPSRRAVYAMATVLGRDIYKYLDVDPPPPDLIEVVENWRTLSEEKKYKIMAIIRANNER
jgi:hypothetical protein